ncbi:hypothetical protein [Sulfurimonas sp.]
MNIKFLVKIKNIILLMAFFIVFVSLQIPIDGRKGQEFFSFFEALFIGGFFLVAQYYLFSDYMYNALLEYGYKIKYNIFQYLGFITTIVVSSITILASLGCCPAN